MFTFARSLTCKFAATVAAAAALVGAPSADAGYIHIEFSGLDFAYNSVAGTVTDTGGHSYSGGTAKLLGSVNFFYGADQNSLAEIAAYTYLDSTLYADVSIGDVAAPAAVAPSVSTSSGTASSGSFFRLFIENGSDLFSLDIDLDNYLLVVTPGAATVSSTEASVVSQNLPLGLAFNPGNVLSVGFNGSIISSSANGFVAKGPGLAAGPGIPEPASLALLGVGAAMVFGRRRAA